MSVSRLRKTPAPVLFARITFLSGLPRSRGNRNQQVPILNGLAGLSFIWVKSTIRDGTHCSISEATCFMRFSDLEQPAKRSMRSTAMGLLIAPACPAREQRQSPDTTEILGAGGVAGAWKSRSERQPPSSARSHAVHVDAHGADAGRLLAIGRNKSHKRSPDYRRGVLRVATPNTWHGHLRGGVAEHRTSGRARSHPGAIDTDPSASGILPNDRHHQHVTPANPMSNTNQPEPSKESTPLECITRKIESGHLLSPEEVAVFGGLHVESIRRAIRQGRLAANRPRGMRDLRITPTEVSKFFGLAA